MKAKITGKYQSDSGVIHIYQQGEGVWRTAYSASGTLPKIPLFTREYRVSLPNDLEGTAFFDGACLRGHFQPKVFASGRWLNGVLTLDELPEILLFGHFEATLRDDGSFDVVIEQWDGKSSKKWSAPNLSEPEMERIETEWVRLES